MPRVFDQLGQELEAVTATESVRVRDPNTGTIRKVKAGKQVPPDLVGPYKVAIGEVDPTADVTIEDVPSGSTVTVDTSTAVGPQPSPAEEEEARQKAAADAKAARDKVIADREAAEQAEQEDAAAHAAEEAAKAEADQVAAAAQVAKEQAETGGGKPPRKNSRSQG